MGVADEAGWGGEPAIVGPLVQAVHIAMISCCEIVLKFLCQSLMSIFAYFKRTLFKRVVFLSIRNYLSPIGSSDLCGEF